MVRPRHPSRASGVIRMVGLLVLLAGIAAMHAGVFVLGEHHSGASAHAAPGAMASALEAMAAEAVAVEAVTSAPEAMAIQDEYSHADTSAAPAEQTPADTGARPHPQVRAEASATLDTHAPADTVATPAAAPVDTPAAPAARDGHATVLAGAYSAPMVRTDPLELDAHRDSGVGCGDGGCLGGHGGIHGCVFILTVLGLTIALVLLYRLAVTRPGSGLAIARHRRSRRARPPPWTVLTLAELAILRI